jgi:hypothetical protein
MGFHSRTRALMNQLDICSSIITTQACSRLVTQLIPMPNADQLIYGVRARVVSCKGTYGPGACSSRWSPPASASPRRWGTCCVTGRCAVDYYAAVRAQVTTGFGFVHLRVEEMVEEPRPEHGHGAIRQATQRPPRLLRPRRRGQLRPPSQPVHQLLGHLAVVVAVVLVLAAAPQRPPRRGGGLEPEPAQYGASQVAEVAPHGPRHQGRVRRRRAAAQRRLERRHHALQLAEVALPPALQLRRNKRTPISIQ